VQKILIVDDPRFFKNLLKKWLRNDLGFEVVCESSMSEVKEILDNNPTDFFEVA
jgi:DNA-binding NtrC family response regulator